MWYSIDLGGGFNPFENEILVKLDHFAKDRGENKKLLKPPPNDTAQMKLFHLHLDFPEIARVPFPFQFATFWGARKLVFPVAS